MHRGKHRLEGGFRDVQATAGDLLADALFVVAAVDSEAVPAEFAVVGVEGKGLLDAVDRLQADVADSVFTDLTIALEVDGVHVLEERLLELRLALAGLGDQLGIHLKAVLAEDRVDLEGTQGGVALLETGLGTGHPKPAKAHLKSGALIAAHHHPLALGGDVLIQLNRDRSRDGRRATGRGLGRAAAATAQGQSQADPGQREETSHPRPTALTPCWRGRLDLHAATLDGRGRWIHHEGRHPEPMDDALLALVEDLGSGNVLDAETLEGCTVEPHELDEMDEDQAAIVAAHVFEQLFDHDVSQQRGESADPEEGVWSGTVDSFKFTIERDDAGDLVLNFSSGD